MLRYAISDRRLFPGDEQTRQQSLVRQAVALAREGVDYFQVREKDLDEVALLDLVVAVRDAVRSSGAPMQVLLNGPLQLCERAGVGSHRAAAAGPASSGGVSCSVHTLDEVRQERHHSALLLFAPVFAKVVTGTQVQPGLGLDQLSKAVAQAGSTPVLALGGVTQHNASLCVAAGAAGIAGIRLFLRA